MRGNVERKEQMRKMRMEGKSYGEIAAIYGISRQRVQQVVGTGCHFREVTEADCVYKGIRDWMNNKRISRTYLVRLLYDDTHPVLQHKISSILKGCNVNKNTIDRILAVTGLTYEEAFGREN